MMAFTITENAMPTASEWEDRAKRLLRAEMARKGVTYQQLTDRLAEIGITEDEHNLRNKVARGKFTAAFLLQCLEALGVDQVNLR
jgi:hypothetical protein